MSDPRGRRMDRRVLGKAVSRAAKSGIPDVLASDVAPASSARLIGVTGPPGAGKSTLINRLVAVRLRRGRTIAVLAIDPTSPVSGGSVLGDRIRMEEIGSDPRVFIRSLPSAGAQDGLSDNIAEIIATLESFGFDEILIETVGVGQAEYAVRSLVQVEILVLVPGAGDQIQAMKAGILETADIFVVNKADLPGAGRLEADLTEVLQPRGLSSSIVCVGTGDAECIARLDDLLEAQLESAADESNLEELRRSRQRFRLESLLQRRVREIVHELPADAWRQSLAALYRDALRRLDATQPSEGHRSREGSGR